MKSIEIGLLGSDADGAVAADVTHLVNRVYATAEEGCGVGARPERRWPRSPN
jgi:hypothetical protein